jgi:hypothetical protein
LLVPVGPRGILPGFTTGSLVCTILQLAYNETGVARLKYIHSISNVERDHDSSRQLEYKERVMGLLGIQKISDEEYLKRLKRKRDIYLQQIKILEQEQEKEGRSDSKEG